MDDEEVLAIAYNIIGLLCASIVAKRGEDSRDTTIRAAAFAEWLAAEEKG